jgi:light-regulated signal transduction histidine kinase (bacteriophytochrome)
VAVSGTDGFGSAAEEAPVDLTNCDREPIHALGAIQSFGLLVAMTLDGIVARASANAAGLLGVASEALVGGKIEDVLAPETMHAVRASLQNVQAPDAVERLFALPLTPGGAPHDLAMYLSDRLVVIEAEPSDRERFDAMGTVRSMIGRLQKTDGDEAFARAAVRQVRALTGFDRVMLYRFDKDGSGEVAAEHHASGLEPYLGLRYPASDIPRQARALYLRNWLRLIADVSDPGVPIEPALGPTGEPIDLSMSVVRAVSPIHLEYLANMGVQASLSISVIVRGELWGLFACHHMAPRRISLERRTAAELFGQMFSWVLEGRERDREADYEANSRRLYQSVMATMADGGSTMRAVLGRLEELSGLVASDGVGAWIDGEVALQGSTPTREEFTALVRFLNLTPAGEAFATEELGRVHPPAQDYAERAAGILAIPISRQPRDYLVFFRREVARSVTWAGNPEKPVTVGPNGVRLTPRKSFQAWREVVRGQSRPWTEADLRIAEQLRVTLLEVILRVTDAAAKERRVSQERQELLIAELNHRVRNILGLIRGLVGQSRSSAESVEGFADTIGGRIQALARAHDQITTAGWGPGSLRSLLRTEVGAYFDDPAGRVRMSGPDVLLDAQATPIVALVVHEMLTNAAKYGALSDRSGHVDISWSFDETGRLVLSWRESGGPAVRAPTRRGFGSTVIERSIPYELRGEAELRYELTGVEARFVVPASAVRPSDEAPEPEGGVAEAAAPPSRGGLGGRALIVEDNMMIALDAEDMILELGADAVTVAASVADALRSIEREPPDYAVLDVNLGTETSMPVAERLAGLGIPFLFATGYGDRMPRPEGLSEAPTVAKPYDAETLRAKLGELLAP